MLEKTECWMNDYPPIYEIWEENIEGYNELWKFLVVNLLDNPRSFGT